MKNLTFNLIAFLIGFWALPSCVNSELPIISTSKEHHKNTFPRLNVDEHLTYDLPVALIAQSPKNEAHQPQTKSTLTFKKLLKSVEKKFPLILAAMESSEIAAGEMMAAKGGFDLKLKSRVGADFLGYYQNESGGVKLEQPLTAFGSTLFGGYKIGRGDFAVWDGDLATNTGGEFSVGVRLPLLAGRTIDKRRIALWKARISQDQAQPLILQKRLEATQKAAASYWKWVASGKKVDVARRLLKLATSRQDAVKLAVKEGEMPRIALVENRQFVIEREAILLRSERFLEQSAIALSLYWRDKKGVPQVPTTQNLPPHLPKPKDPKKIMHSDDISIALLRRPELKLVDLKLREIDLKTRLAKNDQLPQLDMVAAVSQDVGRAIYNPDIKGDVEAGIYLQLEIPFQRRKAKGKTKILSAQTRQIQRSQQLIMDQITADVKNGASALRQTWVGITQARENVVLASEIEKAERLQLDEGESNLFRLNLREKQTASASAALVNIIAEHFLVLAEYRASLGLPYDG